MLRIVETKGMEAIDYPRLYVGTPIDFGEIKLEKDVEENILIPILKRMGYNNTDWTRQL